LKKQKRGKGLKGRTLLHRKGKNHLAQRQARKRKYLRLGGGGGFGLFEKKGKKEIEEGRKGKGQLPTRYKRGRTDPSFTL